jgi:hypothetical protein
MVEAIQRIVRQRALEKAANEVKLVVSSLGPDAAALGAARFAAARSIVNVPSQSIQ